MGETLTTLQAAKIAGVKRGTIHTWLHTGKVKGKKQDRQWLIDVADFNRHLKEREGNKRRFNFSAEAAKKIEQRKKAGTINKITARTLIRAEIRRQARLAYLRKRFPNASQLPPGTIRDFVIERMEPGGITEKRNKK